MNCREIRPEQSQTTNRAKILTQTSPYPVMLLLQALGLGSGNRDVTHHPGLALGIPEGKYIPTFLAALHRKEALKGTELVGELPKACLRLLHDCSGLLWSRSIFSNYFFFWLSLSKGLRSLLPPKNEAGRSSTTRIQLLSKEKSDMVTEKKKVMVWGTGCKKGRKIKAAIKVGSMNHRMTMPILSRPSQWAHLKGNEKAPYNFLLLRNVSIWEPLLNKLWSREASPHGGQFTSTQEISGIIWAGHLKT